MDALITGGTGLVGKALTSRLPRATILSRDPAAAKSKLGDVDVHRWSPLSGPPSPASLCGADVVFNLAGEPVAAGRWTSQKKRRIRESRVVGTRHLVAGLAALEKKPRVLVSASAIRLLRRPRRRRAR